MKQSVILLLPAIVLLAACNRGSHKAASANEAAWLAKSTKVTYETYGPKEDSLLLMNYWQGFKDDVMEGRIDSIARKLPVSSFASCMNRSSASASEKDVYKDYQLFLQAWLEDSVLLKETKITYGLIHPDKTGLFITNVYQAPVSENIITEFSLLFLVSRQKNKIGLSPVECSSMYSLR